MTQEDAIRDLCDRFHASQNCKEIAWFFNACEEINPRVVVEIGVFAGGNLKVLSTVVKDPNGIVVGVDYDWKEWQRASWNFQSHPSNCPVVMLDGDSHNPNTVTKLREILNGREIDVLFVDGDHGEQGCRLDYEMFGELVRPGGIIGFHDLNDYGRHPDVNTLHMGKRNWGVRGFWDDLQHPNKKEFCNKRANGQLDGFGIGYIIK